MLQREQMTNWSNQALYFATLSVAVSVEKMYQLLKNNEVNIDIVHLEERYEKLPIKSMEELKIGGNDLLSWTEKKPGPWIKDVLSLVERNVVEEKLSNDKQLIKEWLKQCHQI